MSSNQQIPRAPRLVTRKGSERIIIQITVTSLFITLLVMTLLAATRSGQAETGSGNVFNSVSRLFDSRNDNSTLLAQQAATATAVTQDGFDGGNQSYAGVNGGPVLDGTGNHFFQGQCTYWAAFRFHRTRRRMPLPFQAWGGMQRSFGGGLGGIRRRHAFICSRIVDSQMKTMV